MTMLTDDVDEGGRMTVPFPLDAFDHAHAGSRRSSRARDRGKLVGVALTMPSMS